MSGVDLLGDPIPENKGKPGANGHVATVENVNKVRMLVIAGLTQRNIAAELGISVPTLNKHYFKNGSIKSAKARVLAESKARVLLQLERQAAGGNVSAIKALLQVIEREEVRLLADNVRKAPPVGKKEAQRKAAFAVVEGGMGGVLPDYGKVGSLD